jgi:pimeloyl-ACP methyl ester carboxylesterase
MPTAKVGDINMYYEDQGQGETLVLIPGIGGDSTYYFRQIPSFSQKYRVIAIDNRGAGRSDKPDIPYTMGMLAADVAGLLDVININSAHILGHSLGGMIAQYFALNYPEKVRTLVLGATICSASHLVKSTLTDVFTTGITTGQPRDLTPRQIFQETLPFGFTQEFINNNQDLIEQYFIESSKYPTPPYTFARQGQAAFGHETYDHLPKIKAPALVIAGDTDAIFSAENSRLIASRIPDAQLVILKNAAHSFQIEAAEETNKIVLSFLSKHNHWGLVQVDEDQS